MIKALLGSYHHGGKKGLHVREFEMELTACDMRARNHCGLSLEKDWHHIVMRTPCSRVPSMLCLIFDDNTGSEQPGFKSRHFMTARHFDMTTFLHSPEHVLNVPSANSDSIFISSVQGNGNGSFNDSSSTFHLTELQTRKQNREAVAKSHREMVDDIDCTCGLHQRCQSRRER